MGKSKAPRFVRLLKSPPFACAKVGGGCSFLEVKSPPFAACAKVVGACVASIKKPSKQALPSSCRHRTRTHTCMHTHTDKPQKNKKTKNKNKKKKKAPRLHVRRWWL